MQDDPSPVNPLPPVVWALFAAIALPEILFGLGGAGMIGGPEAIGWRVMAIRDYGFSGLAFDWMVSNMRFPGEHLTRFVTYLFVHPSVTSTVFSAVIMLAMGKLVGEVLGQRAVIILFFASGILGALVFGLLTSQEWLLGAFPGVYGLIGGYTFILWVRLGQTGEAQARAFSLIGFLMGIQLFFAIFFRTGLDWIADLTGFVAGFVLSALIVPGALRHFLSWLRQR